MEQAVFIVWIPQGLFVQCIPFNKDHWEKIKQTWKFSLKYVSVQHYYIQTLEPFVPNVKKYCWRKIKLICQDEKKLYTV